MKIRMLSDIAPQEYDLRGQSGWAEAIQWHNGCIYDLESHIADMFVVNGDAEFLDFTVKGWGEDVTV